MDVGPQQDAHIALVTSVDQTEAHNGKRQFAFGVSDRNRTSVRTSEEAMNHLLLIDADPDQLATQLRQAFPGHCIEAARTGAVGVAHVRAAAPDVILLNVALPDQSGLDVYRQVRGLDRRIPVIFLAGSKEPKTAIEAMKQGAAAT